LDSLEVYENSKPDDGIPFARLGAGDLAWLGEITLGATRGQLNEVLKRQRLPVTETDRGCETHAPGFHALENNVEFRAWTGRCEFKEGSLIRLVIDASN
jgi:hypothetical protein